MIVDTSKPEAKAKGRFLPRQSANVPPRPRTPKPPDGGLGSSQQQTGHRSEDASGAALPFQPVVADPPTFLAASLSASGDQRVGRTFAEAAIQGRPATADGWNHVGHDGSGHPQRARPSGGPTRGPVAGKKKGKRSHVRVTAGPHSAETLPSREALDELSAQLACTDEGVNVIDIMPAPHGDTHEIVGVCDEPAIALLRKLLPGVAVVAAPLLTQPDVFCVRFLRGQSSATTLSAKCKTHKRFAVLGDTCPTSHPCWVEHGDSTARSNGTVLLKPPVRAVWGVGSVCPTEHAGSTWMQTFLDAHTADIAGIGYDSGGWLRIAPRDGDVTSLMTVARAAGLIARTECIPASREWATHVVFPHGTPLSVQSLAWSRASELTSTHLGSCAAVGEIHQVSYGHQSQQFVSASDAADLVTTFAHGTLRIVVRLTKTARATTPPSPALQKLREQVAKRRGQTSAPSDAESTASDAKLAKHVRRRADRLARTPQVISGAVESDEGPNPVLLAKAARRRQDRADRNAAADPQGGARVRAAALKAAWAPASAAAVKTADQLLDATNDSATSTSSDSSDGGSTTDDASSGSSDSVSTNGTTDTSSSDASSRRDSHASVVPVAVTPVPEDATTAIAREAGLRIDEDSRFDGNLTDPLPHHVLVTEWIHETVKGCASRVTCPERLKACEAKLKLVVEWVFRHGRMQAWTVTTCGLIAGLLVGFRSPTLAREWLDLLAKKKKVETFMKTILMVAHQRPGQLTLQRVRLCETAATAGVASKGDCEGDGSVPIDGDTQQEDTPMTPAPSAKAQRA